MHALRYRRRTAPRNRERDIDSRLEDRMAWLVRGLVLSLALMAFGGCKQGVGERCEITSDCEDGLVCSASQHECTPTGGVDPDAGFIDAAFGDARPADATGPTVDAPVGPDADTTDADLTPDADVTPDAT